MPAQARTVVTAATIVAVRVELKNSSIPRGSAIQAEAPSAGLAVPAIAPAARFVGIASFGRSHSGVWAS